MERTFEVPQAAAGPLVFWAIVVGFVALGEFPDAWTIAGAVIGGVVGNQIGGGSGKTVATVVGAAGGGAGSGAGSGAGLSATLEALASGQKIATCAGFAGEFELRLQLDYRHPLDIARDGSDTNIVDAACSILPNRHR